MRAPPRPAARLAPPLVTLVAALLLGGCKSSPACPAGQVDCGGLCFDLLTDERSCGACLRACPTGATCQAGTCACPAGQLACGRACVDPLMSGAHCGGCDQPCGTGTCDGAGACDCGATTPCPGAGPGQPRCVDTGSDPSNCGACGHACRAGETCDGACVCSLPRRDCPTGCFALGTDEAHCGTTCENAVACPATATCVAGACQCPAGRTRCGDACVDLATDEGNCGICGRACATGGTCTSGTCACPAGREVCGAAPGVCVDTLADEANCGGCAIACAGGRSCLDGVCCLDGQRICGAPALPICCPGTDCCDGGACQLAHSNGLGQTYSSCDPIPTYSFGAAQAAANAWLPTGGTDFVPVPACLPSNCYCRQGPTSAATWCYDNLLVGQVSLNTISTGCLCPPQGNFSGAWD